MGNMQQVVNMCGLRGLIPGSKVTDMAAARNSSVVFAPSAVSAQVQKAWHEAWSKVPCYARGDEKAAMALWFSEELPNILRADTLSAFAASSSKLAMSLAESFLDGLCPHELLAKIECVATCVGANLTDSFIVDVSEKWQEVWTMLPVFALGNEHATKGA